MSAMDRDGGRDFSGLDAHATQLALAEELMVETSDEKDDADHGAGCDAGADEAPPAAAEAETGGEDDAPTPEAPVAWSEEERADHKRMIEALLFAAVEPLDARAIAARLPAGADVEALIAQLAEDYRDRGVRLMRVENKWRFATAPDVAHVLEREQASPRKLSRAALETLAIIAYHQPCTRADIEDVRGVAVSKGSLDQLLEIGWVRLRGKRRDAPGRPTLYGTSEAFLEHFGLESIADLPGLADLKAAGLLDARLPPGFSVPTPMDGEDEGDDGEDGADESDFVQDFMDDGGDDDADGDAEPAGG